MNGLHYGHAGVVNAGVGGWPRAGCDAHKRAVIREWGRHSSGGPRQPMGLATVGTCGVDVRLGLYIGALGG